MHSFRAKRERKKWNNNKNKIIERRMQRRANIDQRKKKNDKYIEMVSTIDEITGLDGFWLLHYIIAAMCRFCERTLSFASFEREFTLLLDDGCREQYIFRAFFLINLSLVRSFNRWHNKFQIVINDIFMETNCAETMSIFILKSFI